ncbi:MAG TPA: MXAN_6521/LA_1396 family lipoprotein [Myxococcaceae bacterium]|nr:MXAN_6521/LA_1396 family lipoprotein [Myxococcaceae bacterium]
MKTWSRAALALAAPSLLLGCTIREARIRADYDKVDKLQTKRLSVVTQPLPEGVQSLGDMWSVMARRQVNLKRQFIAKETAAMVEEFEPKSRCKSGIEGVLWLKPNVKRDGKYLFTEVNATLFRCTDGAVVWEAEGAGRWPQKDDELAQTTAAYVKQFGPDVETYAGPSFHLIKALVDQMPDPVLDEKDKDEKIELGD